jgi:uncharacterized protein YukE
LPEIEAALALTSAGNHQIWAFAAAAHVRVLSGLTRSGEAREAADRYLEQAETAGLGYTCHYLRLALSQAEAELGETASAARHADHVIEAFSAIGAHGLNLVLAREARARVALIAGDAAAFAHYAGLVEASAADGGSHVLLSKHRRLQRDGAALMEGQRPEHERSTPAAVESRLIAALTECVSSQERAQRALDLLLSESGSPHGYLYAIDETGVWLAAENADQQLPAELDELARKRLDSETQQADHTLSTCHTEVNDAVMAWTGADGRSYQPVVLGHDDDDGFAVTGLCVLVVDPAADFRHPALIATCLSRATTRLRDARSA